MTSTVDIKDDSRGRPVQKAKVIISILHNLRAFIGGLRSMLFISGSGILIVHDIVTFTNDSLTS